MGYCPRTMTMTHNLATAAIMWAVFASEALNALHDLRWMLVLMVTLILTDFWWGWSENRMHYKAAKSKREREKYKFHFSAAGRRTLNKLVDYMTYLLVGCVTGLAVTEPLGICGHTTTAAVGIGLGCLFELSSIAGHVCAVKGFDVRLNLKALLVAIVKRKSEAMGEILDEGITEIKDKDKGKE